jgi:hypothetical protein
VLDRDIEDYHARVDRLVAQEGDLAGYVARLESMFDAGLDPDDFDDDDDDRVGGEAADDVPLAQADGDSLIEELEQFLRDQDSD